MTQAIPLQFAHLPEVEISANTVLRAIADNPGCGMRDLLRIFVTGKKGNKLEYVKKVVGGLAAPDRGFVTVEGYRHYLTEKGLTAVPLLPKEGKAPTHQKEKEPAMA